MGQNQGPQTELRAVLKAAFLDEKLPSASSIIDASIPYLDATCEETLRLAGTSKGSVRQALVDTEILGYKIPKGAELLLNYHVNREPFPLNGLQRGMSSQASVAKHGDGFAGVAGRDLASFEPRRWLLKDEAGRETFNAYAIPSLAFGGGFRGCFGECRPCLRFTFAVSYFPSQYLNN